jgi:hypothetical protein
MGEKADWSAAHVKLFCELCANEVLAGHRPLGHLNKVGWKNVKAKFLEKSGRKLEHLQFKNKWDNLKTTYTIFMELKMLLPDLDGMRRDKQWIVMINGGKNILRYVLHCVPIFLLFMIVG